MRLLSPPIRCIRRSTIRIRPRQYASRGSRRLARKPRRRPPDTEEAIMADSTRSQPSTMLLALAAMACRNGAPRLGADELAKHMATLAGWTLKGDRIEKTFSFANYYETMAFVNALAWISHREDHHPDLGVHYN